MSWTEIDGSSTAGVGALVPWAPVINVKSAPYNVTGDGTTDDTAAINLAITAAGNSRLLYFPAGTYKITSSLTFTGVAPLEIRGEGQFTFIVNQAPASNPTFVFSGKQYGRVSDLTIYGKAAYPNDAIKFQKDGSNVRSGFMKFENIYLHPNGNGVHLTDCNTIHFDNLNYWPTTYAPTGATTSANQLKYAVYADGAGAVNAIHFVGGSLIGVDATISGHAELYWNTTATSDMITAEKVELEKVSGTSVDFTNVENFEINKCYVDGTDLKFAAGGGLGRYAKLTNLNNLASIAITGCSHIHVDTVRSAGTFNADGTSQGVEVYNSTFSTSYTNSSSEAVTQNVWGASSVTEEEVFAKAGRWITPAFSAGDYTANSGNWTVASGDVDTFAYTLIGKTMHVVFYIKTTTVSATPTILFRAIPGSHTAAKRAMNPSMYIDNGGAWTQGAVEVLAAGTTLRFLPSGLTGTWSVSTDTTYVYGQITFEIQ